MNRGIEGPIIGLFVVVLVIAASGAAIYYQAEATPDGATGLDVVGPIVDAANVLLIPAVMVVLGLGFAAFVVAAVSVFGRDRPRGFR